MHRPQAPFPVTGPGRPCPAAHTGVAGVAAGTTSPVTAAGDSRHPWDTGASCSMSASLPLCCRLMGARPSGLRRRSRRSSCTPANTGTACYSVSSARVSNGRHVRRPHSSLDLCRPPPVHRGHPRLRAAGTAAATTVRPTTAPALHVRRSHGRRRCRRRRRAGRRGQETPQRAIGPCPGTGAYPMVLAHGSDSEGETEQHGP